MSRCQVQQHSCWAGTECVSWQCCACSRHLQFVVSLQPQLQAHIIWGACCSRKTCPQHCLCCPAPMPECLWGAPALLRCVCWHGAAGAESAEDPLQIELPAALQKQLLDQYDAIHDDNKLLQLPRRPTVMQVGVGFVVGAVGAQAGGVVIGAVDTAACSGRTGRHRLGRTASCMAAIWLIQGGLTVPCVWADGFHVCCHC